MRLQRKTLAKLKQHSLKKQRNLVWQNKRIKRYPAWLDFPQEHAVVDSILMQEFKDFSWVLYKSH